MILRGPYPDVEIPDSSLSDYVFAQSDRWPDTPAIVEGPTGRTLTYAELRDLTKRVAAGLWARGVRKGDTICIYSPNVPEYAAVFFGAAQIGAVVTTANVMYVTDELARQVRDSGSRYIVTVGALAARAREAAATVSADAGRDVR